MELGKNPYSIAESIYKTIKLLPPKKQRLFWFLLLGMVVTAGFETFALGAIAILASGLSDPVTILNSSYYLKVQEHLSIKFIETAPGLIATMSILVVFLVACRNAISTIVSYASSRYAAYINGYVGETLLMGFLKAPYEWHLTQNSADLVTTVNWRQFFGNAINLALLTLSDLIIVACMVVVLIVVEPWISLVIITLIGLIALLIFWNLRGLLDRAAAKCKTLSKSIGRHITKALHGVKDVKIYGKHQFFASDFEHEAYLFARFEAWQLILKRSPARILEIAGFAILSLAICLMLYIMEASLAKITGTIALLSVAAYRMLPAVSRILSGLSNIRGLLPYLTNGFKHLPKIENQYKEISAGGTEEPYFSFNNIIEIKEIFFQYSNAGVPTLSDISFDIHKGESVGIIGPSGAGKSTLVDILIGLLTPTHGSIVVDKKELSKLDVLAWRHKIGYVSQFPYIYDGTLAENIAFGLKDNQMDRKRVSECCAMAHMSEFTNHLPEGIDSKIGERGLKLSGGQRQRVAIARALYYNPEMLVFDEATSSLDSETEKAIQKTIYSFKGSQTLVIIAHRLSTVKDCDTLIWLDEGRLRQIGRPDIVLSEYHDRAKVESAYE